MRLLRSGLYSLWFFVVSTVMFVIGLMVPRDRLMKYAALWSRVVLAGLPVCGVRVVVSGRENLPAGGAMLVASMHQSAFDTLLWLQLVPDCKYVVKAELLRIPMFGVLAGRTGQIAVDRSGGAATMRGLLREGGAALQAGSQVVIFPEGTRVRPGEIVPLQPGIAALATRSGLGVVPVLTDSGRCWRRGAWGKRPGVIHVDILPALPPGLTRAELMARLAGLFEAAALAQRTQREAVDNSVH